MARYDYGLRGPRETMGYDWQYGRRRPLRDPDFSRERMGAYPVSNRVSSPYNQDYVRDRAPVYPVNPFPYGGDNMSRMMGPDEYFSRYMTRSGNWISRGMPQLGWYDRADYGPRYRGRYPDEL